MTKGLIGFVQHRVSCVIGDSAEEREKEQEIYIDLKVEADFSPCLMSDATKDTVDYVMLAEVCAQVAKRGKFRLLESLADRILTKLLSDFPLSWAWVRLKKPRGLPSAEYAMVELERIRKEG